MPEFKPIVSSNLDSASYDAATDICVVRFKNGRAHRYPSFPQSLWKDFAKTFDGKTGSPGSFFAKQIRFLTNERIEDWQ
jgi:hypothetical protein